MQQNNFIIVSSSKCECWHPGECHSAEFALRVSTEKPMHIFFDATFNSTTKKFAYGIVQLSSYGGVCDFAGGNGWCSNAHEAGYRDCKEAHGPVRVFLDRGTCTF